MAETWGQLPGKIIWAVDAFTKDPDLERSALNTIVALTKDLQPEIEPVFVLSDINPGESAYHPDMWRCLNEIMKDVEITGLKTPRVLKNVSPPFGVRKLVQALLDYAESEKAKLIVTHTSNPNRIVRSFIGSFAETLILTSRIPVLLITPQSRGVSEIKTILFATDFSSESEEAYMNVLRRAKSLSAKLVVFHNESPEFAPWIAEKTRMPANALSEQWKSLADKLDVDLELIAEARDANTASAIQGVASEKNADLIAMVSTSGPIGAILLGSTTRQMIRATDRPVWILHPSAIWDR